MKISLRKILGDKKPMREPQDYPKKSHYAIMFFDIENFYIPGDERSRTNPGHGYPAHTQSVHTNEYYVFDDVNEWENVIKNLGQNYKFVAFHVSGIATFETKVEIKIESQIN